MYIRGLATAIINISFQLSMVVMDSERFRYRKVKNHQWCHWPYSLTGRVRGGDLAIFGQWCQHIPAILYTNLKKIPEKETHFILIQNSVLSVTVLKHISLYFSFTTTKKKKKKRKRRICQTCVYRSYPLERLLAHLWSRPLQSSVLSGNTWHADEAALPGNCLETACTARQNPPI